MNPNQRTLKTSANTLMFLDGLRGIAALYVVIGHARGFLWEGYSSGYLTHPENYNFFDKIAMYGLSLFKFGHEVVLFFFMLSGFLIHLKYAKKYKHNPQAKFDYKEYFLRRVKRIYPPFLFAILLTYLLDSLGTSLGYSLYNGTKILESFEISQTHDIRTLLGNFFFLFKVYVPIFGTNGPAWSLKYEWWFYMLYPLLMLLGKQSIFKSTTCILALFIFSFFPLIWPEQLIREVFSMMLSCWFGVLLAEIYTKRINIKIKHASFMIVMLFISPLLAKQNPVIYYTTIGLGMSGLLSTFFWVQQKGVSLTILEKLKWLGNFSYTPYIIHFPLLMLFSGWWMSTHNNNLPINIGLVIVSVILVTMVAYLVHFVTEIPFINNSQINPKTRSADKLIARPSLDSINE
jgi:peptidoglycan/LPS O-acetylase OafA/YrhL